ncbi:hypothetical protein DSO57_1004109 [Entomophthora muscae]|uniref:Uncharacterized protein n=1 Tax=Entomophthora muscae TaxID=34485 RepID=A0ACC2TJJ4_9FUNG|nr:hypothetical protein DSO57_1004109 [Entomophthora muscae]
MHRAKGSVGWAVVVKGFGFINESLTIYPSRWVLTLGCMQMKSIKNRYGNRLLNQSDRIDNSPPLKPQAQEQELNPEPGSPQAAGPMDRGTACLHFSGIKPPQADAKNDDPCSETDQAKEIIAPSGMAITAPNGGIKATTISFMSLKSTPATNQEPTQERGAGPQPSPMTTTLEQDNQVAKLRFLTNERTPGLSAILLPLDPSTQFPQPCLSQFPDEPPMENVKFQGGMLYRPKDPALQTYCYF